MRVFPLSNWTELDIWRYIEAEGIPICPLYFAEERPVVSRAGTLLMVDDERLPLGADERPSHLMVRFRTLGCYPLSATRDEGRIGKQIERGEVELSAPAPRREGDVGSDPGRLTQSER